MTVPSETHRVAYSGAGTTDTFSYTFKIFDEDDLSILVVDDSTGVETTLTIDTDYSVDGIGVAAGGNVTLVDNSQDWLDVDGDLDTGWTLVIRRVIGITQETSITSQSSYLPEFHEKQFDRQAMIAQQQQDEIDRSLKLPTGEDPADFTRTIPPVADRADKLASYDEDGNPSVTEFVTGANSAPVNSQYVVIAVDGTLTNERALTGTANQVTVTDGGAGGNVVLSTPQNTHSAATPTFAGLTLTGGETVSTGDLTLSAGKAAITDSHATTTPQVDLLQSSTGDAGVRMKAGLNSFMIGVDNSEAIDVLKMSTSSSGNAVLGTGDFFAASHNGAVFIGDWVVGLSDPPLGNPLNLRRTTGAGSAPRLLGLEHKVVADSNNILGSYHTSGSVLTTDGTVTSLMAVSPSVLSAALVVEATVVAYRTGGASGSADDSAGYRLAAIYKMSSAGTLTQVGTTTQTVLGESQAGWDATLDASGNQFRVRVTGAAGNNVRWAANVVVTGTTIRVDT